MNCHTSIPVLELLGATIHTREAADTLLQVAETHPCDEVDLDFSGVEFISRSFADQFHVDKICLAQKINKIIIVTNANEPVINMLQAVAKTQNKTDRKFMHVPVYRYNDLKSVERFLISF